MSKEEIRKAIKAIAGTGSGTENKNSVTTAWCKVKAVDWANKTCDVVLDSDDDLLIEGILLGYDKSGAVIKPTVDKLVLVLFVTGTTGVVISAEQTDAMELMGNEFGGLIKIQEQVTKLNNLENLVNNLVAKYNSHTHPIPTLITACGSGAGTTSPSNTTNTAATESTVLTPTVKADLENPKIKHGNG